MTTGPMVTAQFRRILVGWDCSAGAAAALRAAAAIAADGATHIVVLAVLKPAPHTEDAQEGTADFDGRQRFAQESFDKARQGMPQTRARMTMQVVQSSDPARAVCEYAQEHGFDLLVLGRHGTGGVFHPKLGHVAATAARQCSLPVMLAP